MKMKLLVARARITVYAQIEIRDATIRFKDGDSPVTIIEIKIGEGNVTWSERKNMEYVLDRGNLDLVREGDQEPLELTVDAVWEFLTASGGDDPTPEDFVKQRGEGSTLISTSSDLCEPFAIDIEIAHNPACGTVNNELIVFPEFRYETIDHDLREGTLAFAGRVNAVEPTITRSSSTV